MCVKGLSNGDNAPENSREGIQVNRFLMLTIALAGLLFLMLGCAEAPENAQMKEAVDIAAGGLFAFIAERAGLPKGSVDIQFVEEELSKYYRLSDEEILRVKHLLEELSMVRFGGGGFSGDSARKLLAEIDIALKWDESRFRPIFIGTQ